MAGAFAGMVSPVLFGAVLALLTALQHDFMIGIGWRPLVDPADAWPSGLALGPYGFLQIANFVASGLLLALFAIGLHLEVGDGRGSEVGPCLLFVAGAAMALMGFETDPIRRVGPRTLHGLIHDAAFVLFVLALLAALFMLGQRFKTAPLARTLSLHTLHRDARSAVALPAGCGLLPVHRHGAHLDLRHCNMPLAPTLDSDDFRYSQELLVGQKIAFLGLLRVDMGV